MVLLLLESVTGRRTTKEKLISLLGIIFRDFAQEAICLTHSLMELNPS
jgi:hypothetical protein